MKTRIKGIRATKLKKKKAMVSEMTVKELIEKLLDEKMDSAVVLVSVNEEGSEDENIVERIDATRSFVYLRGKEHTA